MARFESGTLPRGNIRITAPDDLGRLLLVDELLAFGRAWPEITFDIHLTNRYVDVVQEGFDLAIRATSGSTLPGAGDLIARKFATSKLYIAARADADPIDSLADLTTHSFVLFRQPTHQQTPRAHAFGSKAQRDGTRPLRPLMTTARWLNLSRKEQALGLMPRLHIDSRKAALRCVLPEYCVATSHLALVYPKPATSASSVVAH